MRRNSLCRRRRPSGSTAPKGSSMSRTGGSTARARATPTRWRSPPESLVREALGVGLRCQPDEGEQLLDARLRPLAVPPDEPRDRGDVLRDGAVREQPDVLDHVADTATERDGVGAHDVLAVEGDPATRRLDEAVDHAQGRRLSAARRTYEDQQLALADLEVEVGDRDGLVAELLADVLEADEDVAWRDARRAAALGVGAVVGRPCAAHGDDATGKSRHRRGLEPGGDRGHPRCPRRCRRQPVPSGR